MAGFTDWNSISDEELAARSRTGDGAAAEALLRRYMPMVKREAQPLFLKGAEDEDLIQEGMLGLFQALRDYDPDRGTAFRTFAVLCVRRQLYSAVEAASRRKHEPLNTAVSYDTALPYEVAMPHEDAEGEFPHVAAMPHEDPEGFPHIAAMPYEDTPPYEKETLTGLPQDAVPAQDTLDPKKSKRKLPEPEAGAGDGALRRPESTRRGNVVLSPNAIPAAPQRTLRDILPSQEAGPEETYISEESSRQLTEAIHRELSPLENEVLELYLGGMHYRDIAAYLDRTPKSIDNALQRIRRKIRILIY